MNPIRFLGQLLPLLLLFAASAAHALTSQHDLLLDIDGQADTGCTVSTSDGPFEGVETILSTTVETDGLADANVTEVTRRECTDPVTDTFGAPANVGGGWPVGVGEGLAGFHVIETSAPVPPALRFRNARIGIVASNELGDSATLLEANGNSIFLRGLPPLPVPIAAGVVLFGLALVLLLLGLLVLGRRGRLTLTSLVLMLGAGAAGAGAAYSGVLAEWGADDLLAETSASDPEGGVGIRALFGQRSSDGLTAFFRIDSALVFAAPPILQADDYTTELTAPISEGPVSGLLANDDRGLPATDLASFGGGDLSAAVTDHAPGATVAVGADGSLTVNADGSFDFQAETGFDGPFTFDYRLENVAGADEATVTIAVQRPAGAVDDAFEGIAGETLDTGSDALLANDTGWPAPQVSAFGGGDLGGAVDDNPAGDSVVVGADGSLTVDADGRVEFLPADGFTGDFSFDYRSDNAAGTDTATVIITVNEVPAITSADNFTCSAGNACEFTFTADGYPDPSIAVTGALPSGVTFNAGTASLEGTPQAGSGDVYTLTVTATNDAGADAEQTFTLTVSEAPTITSAASLGCEVGEPCDFSVSADGQPAPTFSLPGLPAGLSLDGSTGVISGQPDAGTGGEYNLVLEADNSEGSDTQNFTLTVGQPPAITSPDTLDCEVGQGCSLTLAADGFPAPDFSVTGALPAGVTFDGSDLIDGTPQAGSGAVYPLTVTAANGVTPDAVQTLTLTVNEPPAITSAAATTCQTGQACSVQLTADGFPEPSFSVAGTLPSGVTFDAGAGTLTGTPGPDAGGEYALTVTATNGLAPDDTQSFTLTVEQPASITSGNAQSCAVGDPCAFSFTAEGYPAPDFTVAGALPAGVNFDGAADVLTGTPDPGAGGQYALTVTAANGVAPDDTQNFTLTVNEAPAASADPAGAIPTDSAPGSVPYHGALNSQLVVADGSGILDNDLLGFPQAEITDLSLTSDAGGSVAMNAGGGFSYTPPTDFTGLDTFEYCIDNSEGSDCASATVAVGVRPGATDATFGETLIGNVFIDTAETTGYSVLDLTSGDQLDLSLAGATNGDAVLDTDTGTFEFDPAAGFNGDATLNYVVDNGFNQPAAGTVTLSVAGRIWFIDEGAVGSGRLSNPAGSLGAVTGSAATGDSFFLFSGNHGCGVTLGDSQFVIGQGATPSIEAITGLAAPTDSSLPSTGGTQPQLSASDGCLTLGSDNTLRGFDIGNTGTGPALQGNGFNSLFVREMAITGTGQTIAFNAGAGNGADDSLDLILDAADSTASDAAGMEIVNTTGALTVNSAITLGGATGNGLRLAFGSLAFTAPGLTVANAGNNGIDLQGNTATINLGGGAVTGAAANAVRLAGNNTDITYDGDITHSGTGYSFDSDAHAGGDVVLGGNINDTGLGVRIANGSAGLHELSGTTQSLDTGASPAVTLSNNNGLSINFLNGGLAITTSGADGFTATGDGSVTVAGSGNMLDSTNARALTVTNTDIGAGGMTFESIDAGGTDSGIVMTNTGSGGLTVTGSGSPPTPGSGGTIANTSGDGISLTGTRNLSLTGMIVNNTGRHGIYGTGVSAAIPGSGGNAFSFRHGAINAAGDGNDENAIHFGDGPDIDNVSDAVTLHNVIFDAYAENALHLANHTVAADVSVSDSVLRNAATTTNSNGLLLQSLTGASANFDLTVTGTTFGQPSGGDTICCTGITYNAQGSGVHSLVVQNNVFQNMSRAGGGQGLSVATTETGEMSVDISNNQFIDLDGANVGLAPLEDSTMTGTIANNSFTAPNIEGVGISIVGDGEEGSIPSSTGSFTGVFSITGNTIGTATDRFTTGIRLLSRDTSNPNGRMDFTVLNNTVHSLGSGGETVLINSLDSATLCADVSGNTISTDAGSAFDDIGLLQQGSSVLNVAQSSAANVGSVNNGASVFTAGTQNYNSTCNLP